MSKQQQAFAIKTFWLLMTPFCIVYALYFEVPEVQEAWDIYFGLGFWVLLWETFLSNKHIRDLGGTPLV